MYSLRVGEEAMQNVDSPSPKAEYSANCPALNSNLSAVSASLNCSLKVFVSDDSSMRHVYVVHKFSAP